LSFISLLASILGPLRISQTAFLKRASRSAMVAAHATRSPTGLAGSGRKQ